MIMSEEELLKIVQGLQKDMRQIAKDTFWELMDEHLDDYEHKEKKAILNE